MTIADVSSATLSRVVGSNLGRSTGGRGAGPGFRNWPSCQSLWKTRKIIFAKNIGSIKK